MTKTPQLLHGRTAIVTGASRGIGHAIAETFVRAGATVFANARTEGSLDAVCERWTATGPGRAVPAYFDVTDTAGVKSAIMAARKENGGLHVLVNNAGIMRDALVGMASEEMVDDVLGTNLKAVILTSHTAARVMARNPDGGSIINMSSIIGRVGNEGQSVYGASKAGVIGATLSMAKELAPKSIRVNAIAPGFIETDMIKSVPEEKYETILGNIKMGRLGQPQDIANAALFLASDLSAYVTGQVIGVDGGMLV